MSSPPHPHDPPHPHPHPPTADEVRAALAAAADPADAVFLRRYFKTGPGEYGEGDEFIGVRVPAVRAIARGFRGLPLDEVDRLLDDREHEHRLTALVILVGRYPHESDEVFARYLAAVRRGRVNNWDLVDLSAPGIVGEHLADRPRDLLRELAVSPVLWERRVAMLATFAFIRRGDASTTLELAAMLLGDREPLLHKAVGWMLREVGTRIDLSLLLGFLDAHAAAMPRTALSYATEHLTPEQRAGYRAVR